MCLLNRTLVSLERYARRTYESRIRESFYGVIVEFEPDKEMGLTLYATRKSPFEELRTFNNFGAFLPCSLYPDFVEK